MVAEPTLRGIGIPILWMLLPAFLTAQPLLFEPTVSSAAYWMIGLLSCMVVPVVAGSVHRSRGIGYICGCIGAAVFVLLGLLSFLAFASLG